MTHQTQEDILTADEINICQQQQESQDLPYCVSYPCNPYSFYLRRESTQHRGLTLSLELLPCPHLTWKSSASHNVLQAVYMIVLLTQSPALERTAWVKPTSALIGPPPSKTTIVGQTGHMSTLRMVVHSGPTLLAKSQPRHVPQNIPRKAHTSPKKVSLSPASISTQF
jgi:hypothetical protein